MASNIILTFSSDTSVPVKAGTITLYGNEDAAVAATAAHVWHRLTVSRPSPWEVVEYPGFDGITPKFMGSPPRRYIIEGKVFDRAGSEANIKTAIDQVLNLSVGQGFYKITGGIIAHNGTGVIVEDIETTAHGDGTGPNWYFRIMLRDLGV